MPDFSSDAILLRKIEYGDYDYIITYLSETSGKISVIAKNAKKSIRRFQGSLDLFSVMNIQVSFPKKKKDAIPVLANVDLVNPFEKIREDVEKVGFASYWAEIINFYLEEQKPQPELFKLLLFSLDALNSGLISKQVMNLLFQIRFMSISGFAPDLKKCGVCSILIDEAKVSQKKVIFDIQNGCFVCDKCVKKATENSIRISIGTLKQLAWINENEISKAGRIKFSHLAIRESETFLQAFIPFHIGRDFKSLAFLKQI
ncbi:MAG: DNA repair protein RecO, partial [Desulfobacteraceae bacterium]|nr:DNA repair protein RecO [Desulfobacteraceae bacterium]